MEVNSNVKKLFMVVEQGYEKYELNANAALNPEIKQKSKQLLVGEYPRLVFKHERKAEVSADIDEFNSNNNYNESLKDLLRPVLQENEVKRVKMHGKKFDSYAQALGTQSTQQEIVPNKNNEEDMNGKQKEINSNRKEKKSANELEKIIKDMNRQVKN